VRTVDAGTECGREPAPLPGPASKPQRPAKEEILETVLASEKAFLEEGDVDAHLAAWTLDAVLIRARSQQDGPYDVKVPVDKLRPTLRIIVARETRRKVEVDKVVIDVKGEEASMTWRSASSEKATDVFREAFTLRHTREGWRVYEKRYWPAAREEESGERHKFGKASFEEADRQVERFRASGDERNLLYALFGAYRFREALELARRLVSDGSNVDSWLLEMHAISALMMGEAEEASASYARAKEVGQP